MLEKLLATFRLLFNLGSELTELQKSQEKMARDLEEYSDLVRRVVYEMERLKENEAHEREKLELRLRIEILQRQLPPAQSPKEEK